MRTQNDSSKPVLILSASILEQLLFLFMRTGEHFLKWPLQAKSKKSRIPTYRRHAHFYQMTSFKGKTEGRICLEESSRQRWDNQSLSEADAEPAAKKTKREDEEAESCCEDDDDNSNGLDGFECFHFLYFHIVFVPEPKSGSADARATFTNTWTLIAA